MRHAASGETLANLHSRLTSFVCLANENTKGNGSTGGDSCLFKPNSQAMPRDVHIISLALVTRRVTAGRTIQSVNKLSRQQFSLLSSHFLVIKRLCPPGNPSVDNQALPPFFSKPPQNVFRNAALSIHWRCRRRLVRPKRGHC
jgi:hypothetical protein